METIAGVNRLAARPCRVTGSAAQRRGERQRKERSELSDATSHPSAWRLLGIWAGIGLQSFGGGASTTLLIQRTFIERHHWVTAEEFTRLWGICLLTPGINLIAITALLGKRLGGWRGIVASLAGLLLPSGAITCLLAALFAQVAHSTTTQAVLRGIVPATGGVMALVAVNFARPLFRRGADTSLGRIALTVVLALAGGLAVILFNVSAILIVIAAALLGALLFKPQTPRPSPTLEQSAPEERAR